jgi:ABC-type uncharacterized transport system permease subunit
MQYNSNPLQSMTVKAVTTAMLQSLEWIVSIASMASICFFSFIFMLYTVTLTLDKIVNGLKHQLREEDWKEELR